MPSLINNAGTRERLVTSMAKALQRRGLHGVGLNEILAQAKAPKGVLYHHFPGGKAELAVAAIQAISAQVINGLAHVMSSKADPVQALRTWLVGARKLLELSAFESGCPLATVALESTAEDTTIRSALADAFAAIRKQLAATLTRAGVPAAHAKPLSTLIVAAYEGALLQARVAGSSKPMIDTADVLLGLVQTELDAAA